MKRTKEIWVQAQYICEDGSVEIYPNYEVSNFGRVKSLGNDKKRKEKILKLGYSKQSNGTYHKVGIHKNGRKFDRKVHRLVLSSFNPTGYFPNAVVDHIDSVPGDDRLENLRWATQQQNCSTEHRNKKMSKVFTNRKDQSKLVKVTFPDGHQEIFPSAREACRSLCLPMTAVSFCIFKYNGFYKKGNLFFAYI